MPPLIAQPRPLALDFDPVCETDVWPESARSPTPLKSIDGPQTGEWQRRIDLRTGRVYWANLRTKTTQWGRPASVTLGHGAPAASLSWMSRKQPQFQTSPRSESRSKHRLAATAIAALVLVACAAGLLCRPGSPPVQPRPAEDVAPEDLVQLTLEMGRDAERREEYERSEGLFRRGRELAHKYKLHEQSKASELHLASVLHMRGAFPEAEALYYRTLARLRGAQALRREVRTSLLLLYGATGQTMLRDALRSEMTTGVALRAAREPFAGKREAGERRPWQCARAAAMA